MVWNKQHMHITKISPQGHSFLVLRSANIQLRCLSSGDMMMSSNGNFFPVTDPLCGESTGHRLVPSQRPVTQRFDVFFHLKLNKRLYKQSRRRWLETLSRSLWRHCNDITWHNMTIRRAGYRLHCKFTKYMPYFALTGNLRSAFSEHVGDKRPCYKTSFRSFDGMY